MISILSSSSSLWRWWWWWWKRVVLMMMNDTPLPPPPPPMMMMMIITNPTMDEASEPKAKERGDWIMMWRQWLIMAAVVDGSEWAVGEGVGVVLSLVMLIMIMLTAVDVNVLVSFSFVEIRILTWIWGFKVGFQPPLELRRLAKGRYYALKLQPIDRAQWGLSKTPLIAFLLLLQAEIWRIGWIWRK